ncbi:helix-turn-helix domain-containing protein [Loigolactobacillus rennini]|nr:helix-turn-helix domain-containing protein [Loigolactobacillus rennini]
MSMGSILKSHRRRHGISQLQLADKLHISRQSISSWENDRAYPSLDNLIALSELYRISIDDLLKDNEALRDKIFRNQNRIKQYQKQLKHLDHELENKKEKHDDFNFSKKDEFLFTITLIFIGILLLPLGPIIPIGYFIVKKKDKTKHAP